MEGIKMVQKIMKLKDLNQVEAIRNANEIGATILSNKKIDYRFFNHREILDVIKETERINRTPSENCYHGETHRYWTGTLVAHEKPNERLTDAVKYTDKYTGITYVFEVPKEYQNEKNAILVVQHGFSASGNPIITLHEDGKNIFVDISDKNKIKLLPNLPTDNGTYDASNENGIPLGAELRLQPNEEGLHKYGRWPNENIRFLQVMTYDHEGAYVGLIARSDTDVFCNDNRGTVYACGNPSVKRDVLLEMPMGAE